MHLGIITVHLRSQEIPTIGAKPATGADYECFQRVASVCGSGPSAGPDSSWRNRRDLATDCRVSDIRQTLLLCPYLPIGPAK